MKFAFKFAIISSILLQSIAQNGNFDFEVYEYDPVSGSIKPVTLRPNNMRTTNRYQNNVFLNDRRTTAAPTYSNNDRNEISSDVASCNSLLTVHNNYNGASAELNIPIQPNFNRYQIYIKVFMKVATLLTSRYVGDISLVKDKQSTINDISNGLPILYRIRFPTQNPIPKLTAVYYNNQLICTGPHDTGEFITTIQLDHTLYTGLSQQQLKPVQSYNNNNNFVQPQSQPNVQPQRPATRPPVTSSAERTNEFSSQCGVPSYAPGGTTGLVFGGKPVVKGQFPWYAAFHHNGIGSSGFICGGSLVSTKVVLTAAHCVHDKQDSTIRRAEESLFYLGKYYLNSQPNERGFIVSGVKEFKVHSSWNPYALSFDGDIAAAILIRTITFTSYIKPICIWTQTYSYHDIINHNGVVMGYGKTETLSTASDKPSWVDLPTVDEGTCLRSNTAFADITSKRTFCAGHRDGSGPCSGDSGGAYAVKNNGKWYLRGIISSSLRDLNTLTCDTRNYAVFTDTAAYKDWILQIIEING